MSGLLTEQPFRPDKVKDKLRVPRFAEMVADGHSIGSAGRALGLTKGQAAHTWRTIKSALGAQAV